MGVAPDKMITSSSSDEIPYICISVKQAPLYYGDKFLPIGDHYNEVPLYLHCTAALRSVLLRMAGYNSNKCEGKGKHTKEQYYTDVNKQTG